MTRFGGSESPGEQERPNDWRDEVRQGRVGPSEGVPDELRDLFESGEQPTKEIRYVDRPGSGSDSAPDAEDDVAPPIVPGWVERAPRPRGAKRTPPPRVTRRGQDLDPLYIVDIDNRQAYNDYAYPWGNVCRIVTAAGRRGSGVLIGPRHVLTASHVVDWNSSASETVEVHRYGTGWRAASWAIRAWAYTKISDVTSDTVDDDYAVLTLEHRLGDAFGGLGVKTYDSGWDGDGYWSTMGYPTDKGDGLIPHFQQGVYLDEDEFDLGDGRAMRTNADLEHGQSGSPMFGKWESEYVVAVVSAQGGGTNWCSGGVNLGRLVNHARSNDP